MSDYQIILIVAALASFLVTPCAVVGQVDFVRDVRPIFLKHCCECHGEAKQKSGLRLDAKTAAFKGGDNYGIDIVAGKAKESPLIDLVTATDESEVMPPKGKPRLSALEIETLTRWINEGAAWPEGVDLVKLTDKSDHWSFKPLSVTLRSAKERSFAERKEAASLGGEIIDDFIDAKLAEKSLQRAPPTDPVSLIRRLSFDLTGLPPTPEEMQAFADSVSNPNSQNYRQFLSPEEIGERFGPPQSQLDDIAGYLAENGFSISLVGKNRLGIMASATVAQIENAFHTTIRAFSIVPEDAIEPSQFIAPSKPIRLPAKLAPLVLDVSGLETYTHPRHLTTQLTPPLTRGLYNTVNLFNGGNTGVGRTTGVSNFVGFRAANYVSYANHFALPVPVGGVGTNVTVIPISGGAGTGPDNAEGDLDIQMELGMAPLATILVYDGGLNDLIGVLTREANDNLCDTISESYGWNIQSTTANAAHNLHMSMSAEGITYMAASGDNGTGLEPFSYPNSEPEVLQIGGTIANVSTPSGTRLSEVGWFGSGGGWSTKVLSFNIRPPWQTGTGVLALNANTNHRLVPDIAFHASGGGNGAYEFYTGNSTLTANADGTSFAAPIFAGMLAITEQEIITLGGLPADIHGHRRFGRIQDLIYSQNGSAGVWHDITAGNNGVRPDGTSSSCTAGWDSVTGWGPMDCEAFANLFAPSCAAPTVYCTAKLNSVGCLPSISYSGTASATAPSGFFVYADNVRNNKSGLCIYTNGPRAAGAFQGGFLCIGAPVKRTIGLNSGGNAQPFDDCSGVYGLDMNTFARGNLGGGPLAALSIVGALIRCQFWGRDNGFLAPDNTTLSAGLEYTVCP